MIASPSELQAYQALRGLLRPIVPPAEQEALVVQLACLRDLQRAWLLRRAIQERGAGWLLLHHRQGIVRLQAVEVAQLQAAASQDLRRTMEADALRRQLLPLLTSQVPQLVLLKGAATEERAYPKGILRPCIDVDAAVVPSQVRAVRAALRDLGLACLHRDESGRTEHYGHSAGGATLDLHLSLACPKRFPRYGTLQCLQEAVARCEALADGSRVLSPADATLHLLVHLTAGLGGDLRHLADAALWLQAFPPDAVQLAKLASAHGLSRALWAACTWLGDLVPAITLPLLEVLEPRPLADRLLQNLQRQQVLAHYLRSGTALSLPLSALTELWTVDFPRGALGLAAVTFARQLHSER